MTFELCDDSAEGAKIASKYGVKRIELCSALSLGGLTPSYGLIEKCVQEASVEVHAMIRPREGGFVYSKEEINLMAKNIVAAKTAGATGVVFGVLNAKQEISESNQKLFSLAKSLNLDVTFHRAFDFVKDYRKAIEGIIAIGFDRVLTSGLEKTAFEGKKIIGELQLNYGNKIQIMAGSGINENNALKIAETGIENIHFTAKKRKKKFEKLSMGLEMCIDEQKIERIVNLF